MRCRGVCNGRRKPIDADLRETVGRSGGLSLLKYKSHVPLEIWFYSAESESSPCTGAEFLGKNCSPG
jgi:hypothetical protein